MSDSLRPQQYQSTNKRTPPLLAKTGTGVRANSVTKVSEAADWIEAIAEHRDKAAFAKLFAEFAPRLKSFAMRGGLASEAAEEVMQEAMISVWRKAHQYDRTKASPSTWMFTIVRNKRLDLLRRENRPQLQEEDFVHVERTTGGADQLVFALQQNETLRSRLDKLPREQFVVIQKAFFEDKSHSEVAEDLGVPLGTIKSRIRLALGRLRGMVDSDTDGFQGM